MSNQQFTAIQNELNEIDAIISGFQAYQINEGQGVRENLNTYISDLRQQLASTTDRLGIAQNRSNDLEAEKRALEQTIETQMRRVDELTVELANVRQVTSLPQSNAVADTLRAERDALRSDLNESMENYAKVQRKLGEYKTHISDLQAQIRAFSALVPRVAASTAVAGPPSPLVRSRRPSAASNQSTPTLSPATSTESLNETGLRTPTGRSPPSPIGINDLIVQDLESDEDDNTTLAPPSPSRTFTAQAQNIMSFIDQWRSDTSITKVDLKKRIKTFTKPFIEEVSKARGVSVGNKTKDQLIEALVDSLRR